MSCRSYPSTQTPLVTTYPHTTQRRYEYMGGPAPTFFYITLLNMVICCLFGGLLGTILLIPALMCACAVSLL